MFMRFSRCASVSGVNYKINEMVCGCAPKGCSRLMGLNLVVGHTTDLTRVILLLVKK